METKANYVLIGAFTLITGLALLAFGLWAAKYSPTAPGEYRVVFREAVTGLSVGSPVQYNGIAVGSITELNLVPDDPRQVVARIRLNSNTPVKTDTRAKLAITSPTGPSIIQLSGGTPQSPALTTVNRIRHRSSDHALGAAEHHRCGQPHRRAHGPDPQRPQRGLDQRHAGQPGDDQRRPGRPRPGHAGALLSARDAARSLTPR